MEALLATFMDVMEDGIEVNKWIVPCACGRESRMTK